MAGSAAVVVVVVVVPVAPPTGAGEAAVVEACTSIIDELSGALLVVEAGKAVLAPVLTVVFELIAGCSKSDGLESGAGAGELSCA